MELSIVAIANSGIEKGLVTAVQFRTNQKYEFENLYYIVL
ncbi:hypothetical protein C7475_104235 [Chitinophaga sp. S165]|nr:hypothetical protein C7475_104235 [Chitinophaga sp. S165]